MEDTFLKLTKGFASRKHLKNKINIDFIDDDNRPRLYCDEPAIVARFSSHVKQTAIRKWGPNAKVLMRGQTVNFPGMVPSLFRPPSNNCERDILLDAEKELIETIKEELPQDRFNRDKLGALLQHYGLRTSWIDLVDNLWIAIWFATNELKSINGQQFYSSIKDGETGWIYFLSPHAGPRMSQTIDLRDIHHGLSLRPHTQHGWSLKGPENVIADLNQYVVASVEFPSNKKWYFSGYLGSKDFLFPNTRLDHTLKILIDSDINKWARSIEQDKGIPEGSLGSIQSLQ